MEKLRQLFFTTALIFVILFMRRSQANKRRKRQKLCISVLTEDGLMKDTMSGPSTQLHQSFRMEKDDFIQLCEHFRQRGWLQNSKHVKLEEKMMIFLQTVSHGWTNRMLKWRFQHSGSTISRYFHEVLWAMLKFSKEMIVPDWNAPAGQIRHYRRLREGPFKGVVGAMDGTLITAYVPPDEATPYRAKGGKTTWQAVLRICDFDMKFIYVVAGWEGIAHDAKVLTTAVRDPDMKFPHPPPGKYYLCDAAYTHTRGFMGPYRGVRYWLSDWHRYGGSPTNQKERFNHAHAHLRNVIERTFGVLKKRFPILTKMPSYDFPTQRNIVIACMCLHNYLRRVAQNDELFQVADDENAVLNSVEEHEGNNIEAEDNDEDITDIFRPSEMLAMKTTRDQIANQLGRNYLG